MIVVLRSVFLPVCTQQCRHLTAGKLPQLLNAHTMKINHKPQLVTYTIRAELIHSSLCKYLNEKQSRLMRQKLKSADFKVSSIEELKKNPSEV